MNAESDSSTASHTLANLCALVDLPPRTVRHYVQRGLADRPEGETRAARYGAKQLEQLLLIKKWAAAGLSPERNRWLLHGEEPPIAPQAQAIGSLSVRSHVLVVQGVEVVIDPVLASSPPELVLHFVLVVVAAFTQVTDRWKTSANTPSAYSSTNSFTNNPPGYVPSTH